MICRGHGSATIHHCQESSSVPAQEGQRLRANSFATNIDDTWRRMIVNEDCERKARRLTALLKFLRRGVVANQVFEEGQDVLSILNDFLKNGAKLRGAHGFLVPFCEYRGGNLYVPTQFLRGMSAQKKAVENRR